VSDDETSGQHWRLPCPGCRRLLALDLTAVEVAQLAHDRPGIVRVHRPGPDAEGLTLQRWNAQHARGCRYRAAIDREEPQLD
jgi:hypothetical protein